MGMAASQARYLGLTARKINVEYEGQQVNQQRTALANESAGLFRRLMGLENPIPPSQKEYYENVYTYPDSEAADGKITIKECREIEGSNPPLYNVDISYNVNKTFYQSASDKSVAVTEYNDTKPNQCKINIYNGKDFVTREFNKIEKIDKNLAAQLNAAIGIDDYFKEGDSYWTSTDLVSNSTFYIKDGAPFDPKISGTQDGITIATSIQATEQVNKTLENVSMEKSSSGIFTGMKWYEDGEYKTRTLTPAQEYDEQGYNEAMNQYNVDKANYEKEIADINAKTEELQQTDRTLELRLKQLDTEQEALQTELDSVKKVIDKSVDNVFKTFQ